MLSRWITPPIVAFAAVLGFGVTPAGADTAVTYICRSPLGTDAPVQVQVRATLPATASIGQNLDLEWSVDTGLLAPDALPAGAVTQKGTLKISTVIPTATTTSSPAPTSTSSATTSADPATTVVTTSPPNSAAITKGQPLNGGAMKGTYTPRQAGTLSVVPGDISLLITRNGTVQETVCTADAAAPALGSVTVKGTEAATTATPSSTPTPTPTPTVTVTAAPTDTDQGGAVVTPVGGAPTGGGGLAAPDPLPYVAGGGVVLLLAIGIGWELRRRRVHGL
ncbi:hypothetical protein ACFYUV_49670 [Nonomuraea sp. NPDC003560]|uniref:hypothetical protein n=1 Tax=Nonomuraea sp. NPDC003560 TaxID=3364341 RepID=UPI0036B34591